jgi:very-short-patch-repair endonuclease
MNVPSAKSNAEEAFWQAWLAAAPDGADLRREYAFHPTRRWRFDFASPLLKVAVEIEGRGRHQTVAGVRADCEKYNSAAALGWRVFRFPATDWRLAGEWVADLLLAIAQLADDPRGSQLHETAQARP